MENYEAKDLMNRLGKAIGARFELCSSNSKDYRVIAIDRYSSEEYGFLIEDFRRLRTIYLDDAQLEKDGCTDEKILGELREEREKILKDLNL